MSPKTLPNIIGPTGTTTTSGIDEDKLARLLALALQEPESCALALEETNGKGQRTEERKSKHKEDGDQTSSVFGNNLSCKETVEPSGNSRGHGLVHRETVAASPQASLPSQLRGCSSTALHRGAAKCVQLIEPGQSKEDTNIQQAASLTSDKAFWKLWTMPGDVWKQLAPPKGDSKT